MDDAGPDEKLVAALPTNARDYLIPAADNKGHSTRVYCRVPPSVARLVQQVHDSRKYPFRTQGDIIRWCVVNGCKMLVVGHGIPSVWRQVNTMMATLAEEEQQLEFLTFFNKAQQVIDRYRMDNAPGEARRVAARLKAYIEGMPEAENYWKTRYADELLRRWRDLLDGEEADRGVWHVPSVEIPEPETADVD